MLWDVIIFSVGYIRVILLKTDKSISISHKILEICSKFLSASDCWNDENCKDLWKLVFVECFDYFVTHLNMMMMKVICWYHISHQVFKSLLLGIDLFWVISFWRHILARRVSLRFSSRSSCSPPIEIKNKHLENDTGKWSYLTPVFGIISLYVSKFIE